MQILGSACCCPCAAAVDAVAVELLLFLLLLLWLTNLPEEVNVGYPAAGHCRCM